LATVDDILGDFFPVTAATVPSYAGTGVYLSYPTAYSSVDTGSIKFVDTDVISQSGGEVSMDTWITDVVSNSYTGYAGYGLALTSASSLPTGVVKFLFDGHELTFTRVWTPDLRVVNSQDDRGFPFVKINLDDPDCASECTISSIQYKWVKRATDGTWTPMTLQELGVLVKAGGGTLSIKVGSDTSEQVIVISIPETSVEGTIDWVASNASLTNVTEAQFNSFVTSDICNFGLSYDDKLGMRYFQNIYDAAGTCGAAD
jgi:hypothetical protein